MRFEAVGSADPTVRRVRFVRSGTMNDATVSLQLDGATTRYAYTLPHVAFTSPSSFDADARFVSAAAAIRMPAGVEIVDGVVGLVSGDGTTAPACSPSLQVGGGGARVSDGDPAPAATVSGIVAEPRTETLAPFACESPFGAAQMTAVNRTVYPDAALGRHESGAVRVHVMIAPDGRPYDATIASSSGSKALDREAAMAALQSVYEPRRFRCVPVVGESEYDARFEVRSELLITH